MPQATGILPWLTPLAAVGLALTMVGALVFHARRRDKPIDYAINLVFLSMALFVAYGRFVEMA